MFFQFFKYQFKILIRNKMVIFWTLVFPLILATFFNLAFSNLLSNEKFETVNVGVVENSSNSYFMDTLEVLQDSDDKLIKIKVVNEKEAKKLLKEENIKGYYVIDDDIRLVVNGSGIDETILESIVNEFNSTTSTINNVIKVNPNNIKDIINNNIDNFKSDNLGNNVDLTVIYFYTLIGMNCLNASSCGLRTTTMIEGNLSRQGTRLAMSPISKVATVLSGILSAFIIQFFNMLVLMAYLVYGLKINFGSQIGYILLLIAVGCLVGVGLGSFVGNFLKSKTEDNKMTFLTVLSLVLSFFSGMMIIDIKYWMQIHLPIFTYINPVNLITDGLYALYYYDNLNRYTTNILCLLAISLLLILGSIFLTRRKQYDSI